MDLPAIIQKEALYCAVGRCAIRLKETIPFEQWLDTTLITEAQVTDHRFTFMYFSEGYMLLKLVGLVMPSSSAGSPGFSGILCPTSASRRTTRSSGRCSCTSSKIRAPAPMQSCA